MAENFAPFLPLSWIFQYICGKITEIMSLVVVGTVAFDAIETPFGKTDKIIGGAATYSGPPHLILLKISNLFPLSEMIFLLKWLNSSVNPECRRKVFKSKRTENFFLVRKYHIDMNTRDTLDTQLNVLLDFDPVIPESYQDCEFLMLSNLMPQLQKKKSSSAFTNVRAWSWWIPWISGWRLNGMLWWRRSNWWMFSQWTIRKRDNWRMNILWWKQHRRFLLWVPNTSSSKKENTVLCCSTKNRSFFAPALPLEDVFDPTGAGDTFAGGFIGHIAQTRDISFENMKRGIIYGSAMASFCVEKFGMERLVGLSQPEIEERVQQFIDLVQFDIELV